MKSYKQIVELLEDIEEKHLILQSFHAGPLDQVDIAKLGQTDYPLLYCEVMGTTTSLTYLLRVHLLRRDLITNLRGGVVLFLLRCLTQITFVSHLIANV